MKKFISVLVASLASQLGGCATTTNGSASGVHAHNSW